MRLTISKKPILRRIAARRAERAFTMVEIALSLAVVSFALVAIMGVLPTGMTVQRDNREDTLIAQEGRFWLEAIKGGARGAEDITHYVEEIVLTNNNVLTLNIGNNPLVLNARDIVALLSTPKLHSNDVSVARVRAITGLASERGTNNAAPFRYQLRAEVEPVRLLPPAFLQGQGDTNLAKFSALVGMNLFNVRLVLRWPVVERGNGWHVGNNRKVFRATISGQMRPEQDLSKALPPNLALRSIHPNQFSEFSQ